MALSMGVNGLSYRGWQDGTFATGRGNEAEQALRGVVRGCAAGGASNAGTTGGADGRLTADNRLLGDRGTPVDGAGGDPAAGGTSARRAGGGSGGVRLSGAESGCERG